MIVIYDSRVIPDLVYTMYMILVAVARLAEQLHPMPDNHSSNPFNGQCWSCYPEQINVA